jgi:YHS domain-containing protein
LTSLKIQETIKRFAHNLLQDQIKMTKPVNVDDNKLAMQGYCPVSYLFGPPQVGDEAHSSEFEGAIYRFASAQGKEMFDAEPAKYAPVYGGFCATGMAHGGLVPVDPLNFKMVDDKLHLFLKNEEMDTLEVWNKDEAGTKAKAEANWASGSYAKK